MTTASQTLKSLLPQWHSLLKGWAADGSLEAAAQEALMLGETPTRLKRLIDQWATGEFRNIPEIILLPNEDISGAMGAYAISTGKIYLNQDWLLGASAAQVISVLTEELGHHLDGQLNEVDTPGDEGEYFASAMRGKVIDGKSIIQIRQQVDKGTIQAEGQTTASEFANTPAVLGNSLYTLTGIGTWTDTQSQATILGGNLVTINSPLENAFLVERFYAPPTKYAAWIGYFQTGGNAGYNWVNGEDSTYTNWAPGHPDFPSWEFYAHIDLYPVGNIYGGGRWADSDNYGNGNQGLSEGIAEIPITFSVTQPSQPKEGAGLLTTSITISAGNQASGNLAEGSQVYWKIDGITADDLSSGALAGTGFINNGRLDIQHSLAVDGDRGEKFSLSVYSDAAMTQQIGSTSSATVQEDLPTLWGNSLYTIVTGSSWTAAEANSVTLGGHLLAIGSAEENSFIWQEFSDPSKYMVAWHGNAPNVFAHWIGLNDAATEGSWVWSNGDPLTYINPPFLGQLGVIREGFSNTSENYIVTTWNVPTSWTDGTPTQGIWQDTTNTYYDQNYAPTGIAEIHLTLSITRTGTVKEDTGVFTTSINLFAGNATSGNLAEGATVYWKIDGITADDLDVGSALLSGSGTIADGKLDLQHSLIKDADTGEQFTVSVFSDATLTQQIGTSFSQAILEENATPTDLTLSGTTCNENVSAGTFVANLSSTDPDAADTFTYSLVTGTGSTDNAAFSISGSQLLINTSPDFESKSSYSIRLRTTDAGGLFFEKAVTINIQNLQEGPAQFQIKGDGTCSLTQTLTCTLLTPDPDRLAPAPAGSYSYKWETSTNGTTAWTAITGATASTYALKATDSNKSIRCVVSYTDGFGALTSVITNNIRTIAGTRSANNLIGSDGVDIQDGGAGNDDLRSGKDDDFVGGGDGNDSFTAADGDGNDFCDGGAGTDTLRYNLATTGVTVDMLNGKATGLTTGTDSFKNAENVLGSTKADSITGNSVVNTFTGNGGADTYSFLNKQAFGAATSDKITDFSSDDKILLSRSAFGIAPTAALSCATVSGTTALNTALTTANLFVYDTSTGNIYWNQNGTAAGAGTGGIFAVLTNRFATFSAANLGLVA